MQARVLKTVGAGASRALLLTLMLLSPTGGAEAVGSAPVAAQEAAPSAEIAAFYTRPLVRARLRVPASLQDYTVTAIAPSTDDPTRFDVDVHFKARTPFGATTAHSARFQMKRAAVTADWIVTAQ